MKTQKKEIAITPEESALLAKVKEALSLGIDVDKLIEDVKAARHNNDTEE